MTTATAVIWSARTPDRSHVWFLCTAHLSELLARQPDLIIAPAQVRSYCSGCPSHLN
jgi:hypothetical protein